jgi:AraC-like DNA-binding protein
LATAVRPFPARYIVEFLECAEAAGADRAEMERAARVRLVDSRAQLQLRQVEALLASAERLTGRLDLGFELGRRLKTTSHDILGLALLTSPTLRDALRLLSNYQRLINPTFTLSLQHRAGRLDLVYRPAMAMSHRMMRILQEAIAVSNDHEFRALMQRDLPPYDLHFSVERPAHASRYRDLASARIHWGESLPGLRMSLDDRILDKPLALADPRAMQAAEERCAAMMRDGRGSRRWSDWCRMMLREAEDCQPTLEQLARFVNVSSRTLGRYLEAERVGFRELSLQVRTERAREMLADGGQSVTQVAYRLGYSDVASFIRSFRDQTGRTPGEYGASRSRR